MFKKDEPKQSIHYGLTGLIASLMGLASVSISISVAASPLSVSAHSVTGERREVRSACGSLWLEAIKGASLSGTIDWEQLERVWQRVSCAHPAKKWMPSEVGILVDPQWKGSAGFWSRSLSTSQGVPAIVLPMRVFSNELSLTTMLAHELTHLIEGHRSDLPLSSSWWSEGTAMLAERAITGKTSSAWMSGWETPERGLFEELGFSAIELREGKANVTDKLPAYGHVLQFMTYVDRVCFGGKLVESYFKRLSSGAGIRDGEGLSGLFLDYGSPIHAAQGAGLCGDFKRLFSAFQKARFLQAMHKPLEFVVPTTGRALIRPAGAKPPQGLPPYSATAHFLGAGQTSCGPGEELLELPDAVDSQRFCLKVRLK